jgi:hypothetical protein
MTTIIERKKGRPGAKHFKTEVKHARQKGYTIIVAMGEFLDYPILNATYIDITIKYKPGWEKKKILQIQITDNTQTGFENLKEDNDKNPFNYGYNSSSHDDDESISEFGAGLKEAFIALSDKITIYTRSDGEYFKIVFNIEKMSNIVDANESYNYDEKIISQSEYIEEHKLQCGSSIILEEMVDGIIINDDELKRAIIKIYGKIIKKRKIVVKLNGEQLIDDSNTSPFDNEYCKPFNTITKLYAKKNDSNNEEYNMEVITKSKTKYYQYKNDSKPTWSEIRPITDINKLKAYKNWYPECLIECKQIEEIMTITGTETQFCKNKTELLTMGEVFLYKRGRQHGSYFCKSRNGSYNSVYLELEIYSKKIGKELGMTVNKLIKLNKENKLCNVVIETIHFMQHNHAYDSNNATAEKKYNIIKETGLDITHVPFPTRLKEREAEKAAVEKAAAEKAALKKTPTEKTQVEKTPAEKTPAEKTPAEKTPAEKTPAEKTPAEKTPVKKVEVEEKRTLAEKTVIEKVATERPPIKKTEIEEKKALAEKTVIKKVEAEKVTTERPLIKKTEVEKTIAERIKTKAEELPLSSIVHSYRKKSVEVKKFKEVINTYINKFKDNEMIGDEDLKIYNNICNMLNISP